MYEVAACALVGTASLACTAASTGLPLQDSDQPDAPSQPEPGPRRTGTAFITGRVIDSAGKGIDGAVLGIFDIRDTTGPGGSFEIQLPRMPSGSVSLGIAASGRAPIAIDPAELVSRSSAEPLTFVLRESEHRIKGRVLDLEGQPVPGWALHRLDGIVIDDLSVPPVHAEDLLRDGLRPCITTDENGGFELSGLASRPYRVLACDPWTLLTTEGTWQPGDGCEFELTVDPSIRPPPLEGTLLAPDGAPVPWALVRPVLVPPESDAAVPMEDGPWTKSDEEGRFRIASLARGAHVRLLLGDERVVPRAVRLEELEVSPGGIVRCERFLRLKLTGLPQWDPRWSSLLLQALDEGGNRKTLHAVSKGDWTFGEMLPLSAFAEATLCVSELARTLLVLDPAAVQTAARIELGANPWRAEPIRLDLAQHLEQAGSAR